METAVEINKTADCLVKLESFLRSLNVAERKAAKYILKNPATVLDMTISEVAAKSGVSETSVYKMCRSLDFSGFREFKITLARQYRSPESFPLANEPVRKTDSATSIAHKVFRFALGALHDTLKIMNFDGLEHAYTALLGARRVLVASLGISRITSIYAADKLAFFGIDAQAATDVHVQAMRASTLTSKDVLLAFCRSGDTRDIIETVQIAKEQGAATIGVTNNPRSFFAKTVDIPIFVASKDAQWHWDVLASRIEHLCVVDTLYTMLAARNKRRAKSLYERVQKAASFKQY